MKELLKSLYWNLQPVHLLEKVIGTKAREMEWANKDLRKGNNWCGQDHAHRETLCNIIASYKPESVLEIGCNEGQNLIRLAKMLPDCKMNGIDVNEKALRRAMATFEENNLHNYIFSTHSANDLRLWPAKYDVVFTDATLIYVGNDKIYDVIKQINRITERAIIFCEWHKESAKLDGEYYRGCWIRNYHALAWLYDIKEVKITKITPEMWNDKLWSKYGAIIEVKLS